MNHIIRRAEELISEHANRRDIRRDCAMDVQPIDEQARYIAHVYYHAEQLGVALGEVASWLQRTAETTPVAQRRARGAERSARESLPSIQWGPRPSADPGGPQPT